MEVSEQEAPFRPPLPRPMKQIWTAAYRLTRQEFLDAVEQVMPQVAHPTEGLHWEYEGFRRHTLFIFQPADDERGLPLNSVELGLHIEPPEVSLYVNTSDEVELQLFRRLTTELDGLRHVAAACIAPCSFIATQPQPGDWFRGTPSGVGVFVAPPPSSEEDV